jgi:hypothetical protein
MYPFHKPFDAFGISPQIFDVVGDGVEYDQGRSCTLGRMPLAVHSATSTMQQTGAGPAFPTIHTIP